MYYKMFLFSICIWIKWIIVNVFSKIIVVIFVEFNLNMRKVCIYSFKILNSFNISIKLMFVFMVVFL